MATVGSTPESYCAPPTQCTEHTAAEGKAGLASGSWGESAEHVPTAPSMVPIISAANCRTRGRTPPARNGRKRIEPPRKIVEHEGAHPDAGQGVSGVL